MVSKIPTVKSYQKDSGRNRSAHMTAVVFTLSLASLLLAGCDNYRPTIKCEDHIRPGDKGNFTTDDQGLARDKKTATVWYRCPGGKTYLNFRCAGEALYLNWDDAKQYAKEFSEKSAANWRLPTNDEMKSIMETSCVAPAINKNIFPDAEVANHWTSSNSWHQKMFKCAVNLYNGSLSCRQAKVIEQPFMLVRDKG